MTEKYIRFFEPSMSDYLFISEAYLDTKIRMQPDRKGQGVRIEGPLSEKARIDRLIELYDHGGK